MASIKDLKKRIGTVKNTQQTTRAMKMVSAAKLRRAQEAILSQRPYARRIGNLIRDLAFSLELSEENYPLLFRKKSNPGEEEANQSAESSGKTLLVVVTSDRGLCGGFNSSVIKTTQKWVQQNTKGNGTIELAFVGRKGFEFFRGKKLTVAANYPECGGKVDFAKAKKLSSILVEQFLNEKYTDIKFVYNEFKNAVTQKVIVEGFLPFAQGDSIAAKKQDESSGKVQPREIQNYIIKPNAEEVLRQLLEKNFAIQVYRVLLESQAGEHGARMSAMENATKNAGEMIRKLTLQFNKQRQAGITKELLEIISGSESQKA